MEISNTYLIMWYGPFDSVDSLKEWEDSQTDQNFNLYIFQARLSGYYDSYYCGMTFKQSVGKRLKNHDHHIHDFENDDTELLQIWIGTIANVKADEWDIRVCENIITSVLANPELGVGEDNLENRTNKKPPVNNVYVINEWWKVNGDSISEISRRAKNSVPYVVPEILEYYSETKAVYGARKLKHLVNL
ncbi:MAG: hypothetical protein II852_03420 [Bacteroidales bacterium]|nr:hypothetical protein [Bacteroidales bacterium]